MVLVGPEMAGNAGAVLQDPRRIITGTHWEGIGVVPDVKVPAAEALARAHRLALGREQPGPRVRAGRA